MNRSSRLAANWSKEILLISRYAGSGVLNTVIGFSVIFLAMVAGFSPVASNVGGYAVRFVLGFVFSKKFVFRSDGHFVKESYRYLLAFIVAFLCNLFILQFLIDRFQTNLFLAQIVAAITYTVLMYLISRFFVFNSSLK